MTIESDLWGAGQWITGADLLAKNCDCGIDANDPDDQELADEIAGRVSSIMYMMSGRRVSGPITVTVRALYRRRNQPRGLVAERRVNDQVHLQGPVVSVGSVTVDGVPLVEGTDFYLRDRWILQRMTDDVGRTRSWPTNTRTGVPSGEKGCFEIEYTFGAAPPGFGVDGALELGCVLLREARPSGGTPVPGATSGTRGGLSLSVAAHADRVRGDVSAAPESFPALARFMSMVNAGGATMRPWVDTIDLPYELVRVD